jgi:hypothetical protein
MRIAARACAAALGLTSAALVVAGTGTAAQAGTVPPPTISYGILWNIAGGTLSVQSTDAVNHVIGTLTPAVNSVAVICQTNSGGTDPYDGLSSHTWDEIWWGGRVAYVYDWYINTPPQGSNGYSQGTNNEGQGPPPHC